MAKILSILINPHPILRRKSREIGPEEIGSADTKELCLDMMKTMAAKDGVGLAAPQVGRNIRLIAINVKNEPIVMLNPKITKKSWAKEWGEEGCLSLPGIFGRVKRHRKIKCVYIDGNGTGKKMDAAGLLARVIQHEIDHLDGILFIDRTKKITRAK